MNYSIGDTIFFLNGGISTSGVITAINSNNGVIVSYTVIGSSGTFTVPAADAYPNAFPIVSVTPTMTFGVTATPSRTPNSSPTVSLSPSSTVSYPNLFVSNSTVGWVATNGTISTTGGKYINFSRDGGNPTTPLVYSVPFTVVPGNYYDFRFDYEQGTIRFAKVTLEGNAGALLTSSQLVTYEGNKVVFGNLDDSGRVETAIYVPQATVLLLTFEFFDGPNFDGYPNSDFTYAITNTLLQQINQSISLTPSSTATPTPTATNSPTLTPTKTPNYIPLTCYARLVIADNALIYYKFDERTGTSAVIDYSGNNINATYNNVLLQQNPLVSGPGFSAQFGNSSSPSFAVTNNDNRYKTIYGDFTVEFSIEASATQPVNSSVFTLPIGSTGNLATMNATINPHGYLLFNLSTLDGVFSVISDVPVTDGVPRMFSIGRTGNVLTMWDRGVIVDQITVTNQNNTGTNFLYIGGYTNDPSYNFNGVIDDFSIYKYGLTQSQINNHLNCWIDNNSIALTPTPTPSVTPSSGSCRNIILGSSPLAYWRMDDSDGTVRDALGTHNGTINGVLLENQPSLTTNFTDASMTNNGVGSVSVFNLRRDFSFATNNFTIEFYAAANQFQTGLGYAIAKVSDPVQQTFNYGFYVDPFGFGSFIVYINGQPTKVETSIAINDNQPRMFHLIRQDRNISIYINGILDNSVTLPGTGSLDTAVTDFEMFGSQYIPNSTFLGSLDEVAVYTRALSPLEITSHYSCGMVATPTPTPSRTVSLTPSRTPTPTNTTTPTISITPTISVTPSVTPTISNTPTHTPTISVTPSTTLTISFTPTISNTPSATPTISHTPTQSSTSTPTPSPTISSTPSVTPTISVSPTISNTPSVTPTNSVTPSVTPTISNTSSVTPTISVTPSNTVTQSFTPTQTRTVTPTITVTRTLTPTPTVTPSITVSTSVPANPYAQSILNSLQNWWDMEEASSANRVDSKDKVIMAPQGNISTVNGLIGSAVQVVPTTVNSALSSMISENLVNYGTSFTVGAFVNINSLLLSSAQPTLTLVSRWSDERFQMQIVYAKSTGALTFSISNNGGDTYSVSTANVSSTVLDQWALVTGIYDAVAKTISITLNGSTRVNAPYTLGYYGITQPFVIGNNGFFNAPWAGAIDSTFICLKALNAQEIGFLWNGGAGTNYARLLANGFIVDTGQIAQFYGGDSLASFTNVGGVVNPNVGVPAPAFEYAGHTYSYNKILTTQYFDRVEFDFNLAANSTLDFYIANDPNGFGNYLKLTSVPTDVCGISQCLNWTDYEMPTAITQFPPITDTNWHHGVIKMNYVNNVRYMSVYVDGNCMVYYYPIADGNIFYGFGNEYQNLSDLDNVTVYTTINPPQITPSVTPSSTLNPTPSPSLSGTRTPTPTPSLTLSPTISPSVTPSTSQTTFIITDNYFTDFESGKPNYFVGSNFNISSCGNPGNGLSTSLMAAGNSNQLNSYSGSSTVVVRFNAPQPIYVWFDYNYTYSSNTPINTNAAHASGTVVITIDGATAYSFPFSYDGTGNLSGSGTRQYPNVLVPAGAHSMNITFNYNASSVGNYGQWYQGTFCMDNFNANFIPPPTQTPTATPSPTPSPTISVSQSVTPSVTASTSLTPTPTRTFTPTPTQTPSITQSVSLTPSITPTISNSLTPSVTPTISHTASVSISLTPSVTSSVSLTPSITPTISLTQSPSLTASVTPTISVTPSITVSPTLTHTPSVTPTISVTPPISVTPTISITPSSTPLSAVAVQIDSVSRLILKTKT